MLPVLKLLEHEERVARERVESLRAEADRVLDELARAETDWEGWAVARQRVRQVMSAPAEGRSGTGAAEAALTAARQESGSAHERVLDARAWAAD
jgi:hypothetical protein